MAVKTPRIPEGAALSRQMRQARAREKRERAAGRRAAAVRFDRAARRVVVELTNGLQVAFPVTVFPEISGQPADVMAGVAMSPSGSGIQWDALDVHYDVPALLASIAGAHASARTLGRAGGSKRSDAKAAAARANGARGGRPRRRRTIAKAKPVRQPE